MPKISSRLSLKTPKEIEIMAEGGRRLAKIKEELKNSIKEGVEAIQIEKKAEKLIEKAGGQASFKMVPDYSWATCINVNQGLVHGIPKKGLFFKKGDVVSLDVGFYYQGFHTDTAFSLAIDPDPEIERLLKVGEKALNESIKKVKPGNRIDDLSKVIEETIKGAGFSPIKALVGHGVGRSLHEEPQIPCYLTGERKDSPKIEEGLVLAIEVMYARGSEEVKYSEDGWTIFMRDGKISALFEETVAATSHGPLILTRG